ncbi:Lrp/AsnC family transcriptional regulator [Streptomyces sp. CRPSP2-6A1]|uniref:Lrp/AsnC family transcriptional regulator n=1 Tax=Streptomyces TaxID=1883 RepID=UPI0018F0ADEF|nr:AsnC family transcriptional regulator [Streptomyces sp. CRPSP2-6A1]MBJ7004818.1 Lrp/AsnC family transcriptional regulator [Streptomyces sp. CRPSP2-6A1]
MDSSTLDEVDQRLVHELQQDGRAPFSRIAEAVGVSEHTVARRYRRLLSLGLRVIAVPGRRDPGPTGWLLRVTCVPDSSVKIADALARRPDTAWVALASGGTEVHCAVQTHTVGERDALLLHKLPHTPRVVSVDAHCLLHAFADASEAWRIPAASPQAARPGGRPAPEPAAPDPVDEQLLAELARDGRRALTDLARSTGRSPAAVTRRLERLRATGAMRFVVEFSPEHLGYRVLVRFWLRVAPGQLGAVGSALAARPEISYVAAYTGVANLIAFGMFRDTEELYRFLDHRIGTLPGVQSVETTPILREVKRLTYDRTPTR